MPGIEGSAIRSAACWGPRDWTLLTEGDAWRPHSCIHRQPLQVRGAALNTPTVLPATPLLLYYAHTMVM
jgi:hypothetical protein